MSRSVKAEEVPSYPRWSPIDHRRAERKTRWVSSNYAIWLQPPEETHEWNLSTPCKSYQPNKQNTKDYEVTF